MSEPVDPLVPRSARTRLSADARRQQLVSIGLALLVDQPIHDLSLDRVATAAGISRGLLFHYFADKGEYLDAVLDAAARRVERNTRPAEGATGDAALRQLVGGLFGQIDRRRDFYLALVFGQGSLSLGGDRVWNLRTHVAAQAMTHLDLSQRHLPTAHAWVAYVEDRAVRWSAGPAASRSSTLGDEVTSCIAALHALVALVDRG